VCNYNKIFIAAKSAWMCQYCRHNRMNILWSSAVSPCTICIWLITALFDGTWLLELLKSWKNSLSCLFAVCGIHYCLQLLSIVFCSMDLCLSPWLLKQWSALEFVWGPVIYLHCSRVCCNFNWKMQQVRDGWQCYVAGFEGCLNARGPW
jgi:hypothetical protein